MSLVFFFFTFLPPFSELVAASSQGRDCHRVMLSSTGPARRAAVMASGGPSQNGREIDQS